MIQVNNRFEIGDVVLFDYASLEWGMIVGICVTIADDGPLNCYKIVRGWFTDNISKPAPKIVYELRRAIHTVNEKYEVSIPEDYCYRNIEEYRAARYKRIDEILEPQKTGIFAK